MTTDPRTGRRTIRPARESFAALAFLFLLAGTVLRAACGRPGGMAGAILTLIAVAVLSRFQVSWDQHGIYCRNPLFTSRRRWSEFSAYRVETVFTPRRAPGFAPAVFRLRLYGPAAELVILLAAFSSQDARHLCDRIAAELPLHEPEAALVS